MAKKLKPMVRLTEKQIRDKLDFIENYRDKTINAATASSVDANANIHTKNISNLAGELWKDGNIQIKRYAVKQKLIEMYGEEFAQDYENMVEDHLLYIHDETSPLGTPYCAAISMWPLLEDGLLKFGGESRAPKHLESFCGNCINLLYAASSNLAGAVATAEFLLYFHYFAIKDYGKDYINTHRSLILDKFQHIIYSLNTPCAARSYQAIFWNISVFDKYFYNQMFEFFAFPDGTRFTYDEFNPLQKLFLEWFTNERQNALLTFPVITEASLNENNEPKDKEWAKFIAEIRSKGLSFFSYNSNSVDSLSSCCRLRNQIEQNEFQYSLGGAGAIETGSVQVISINLLRLFAKNYNLEEVIRKVHKIHIAYRQIVIDAKNGGLLPIYDAGFLHIEKQFNTLGISGLNEAAEFLGYEVSNNEEYINWVTKIVSTFAKLNSEAKTEYKIKFNTELVPGESLGIKNCSWDKQDGIYKGERNCYNSYIYLPESTTTSIPDKFQLHGGSIAKNLDGGSALHLNLSQLPDKDFFYWLRCLAAKYGCNYWTTNVLETCCENCNHNDFRTLDKCPVCGSTNISYATRIIGYLKKIKSFSDGRQIESAARYYH